MRSGASTPCARLPSSSSALPGSTCPLLARDRAGPGTTLALARAISLGSGRVRPLAWCSRPKSRTAPPERTLMFDLRYHVASLAAVFLALIIGILVGVGISGPVDNQKTKFLEAQVAKYQRQLDQNAAKSTDDAREQEAARTFISD